MAAGAQAAKSSIRSAKWAARNIHRLVCKLEPWGIIVAMAGVVPASITFIVEFEDRQDEREFRAWQVVGTVEAGFGVREAIEYLNQEARGRFCIPSITSKRDGSPARRCLIPRKERQSLAGVDVQDHDLTGVDLTKAILSNEARLDKTILKDAILTDADLTDAYLGGADLTDANLTRANLRDAKNLTQAQLDASCGDSSPLHIPNRLKWRSARCPER